MFDLSPDCILSRQRTVGSDGYQGGDAKVKRGAIKGCSLVPRNRRHPALSRAQKWVRFFVD